MTPQSAPQVDREVTAFLAAHPALDLSTFDFYDRATVDRLALPTQRADALLGKLRARQRVRRFTPDRQVAEALIAACFDSARRLAAMPEHRFVSDHAGLFGGDEHAAAHAHEQARAVKAAVTHLVANLH